jgi:hypothetical protein
MKSVTCFENMEHLSHLCCCSLIQFFCVIDSYCECFAAGVYCVDSCACENCFNKPEYDDLVLDTRQQIESRDPLAFTPKIITHATDSLENVMVITSQSIYVALYCD